MSRQFTVRDEANAITAFCFRNTFLEDLHAGKHSEEFVRDQTYSRITDEEMKTLMIEASSKLEELLKFRSQRPDLFRKFIQIYHQLYASDWDTETKYRLRAPKNRRKASRIESTDADGQKRT